MVKTNKQWAGHFFSIILSVQPISKQVRVSKCKMPQQKKQFTECFIMIVLPLGKKKDHEMHNFERNV